MGQGPARGRTSLNDRSRSTRFPRRDSRMSVSSQDETTVVAELAADAKPVIELRRDRQVRPAGEAHVRLDRGAVRFSQPLAQPQHRSFLANVHDSGRRAGGGCPGARLLHRHGRPGAGIRPCRRGPFADRRNRLLPRDARPGPCQGQEGRRSRAGHARGGGHSALARPQQHLRCGERGLRTCEMCATRSAASTR